MDTEQKKQRKPRKKVYLREWIADLCGLSPRITSFLFLEGGYDPHEVREWILKTKDASPGRIWDSGKTRKRTKQELLSEKMKEIRKGQVRAGTAPVPPKRGSDKVGGKLSDRWDEYDPSEED